ncbi:transporter [Mycobacterium sp.]|uniref:PH-like domain-containing protein n=1 Tax=Mycobacterium sp. TaxID=1785 RepID=UPI003D6C40EE
MNSSTLVGSLIFAAVLAVLIAFVIQLMVRGWRRRGERQATLIGTLPAVPDTVGTPTVAPTRGLYCGCTLSPAWNERITASDLGYRSKAVLTRYPEGIMVQRSGASPIWIPQESIKAIRMERGIAGKVVARIGILAIRWRLPSNVEIDIGFRANNRSEYARWLQEAQ